MEITHTPSSWRILYNDGAPGGPQKLLLDDKSAFSFVHNRLDDVSEDEMDTLCSHHYHRGGCHVFEGEGVFPNGVRLRQTAHIAAK